MKSWKSLKNQFFLSSLILLILPACSSEKKLERVLHKKEGKWNIASIIWEDQFPGDTTDYYIVSGHTENAGYFTFEKDYSGKYGFVVNDRGYFETYKWSVNETNIRAYRDYPLSGISIDFQGYQLNDHKLLLDGKISSYWEDRELRATVTLLK